MATMNLSAVMNLTGNFYAGIQKNLEGIQKFQEQTKGVSQSISKMSEAVKNSKVGQMGASMAQGLSVARDAIGATGLATAGFLKGCIDGAAKGQKINMDLAQTIKSTGGAAGLTAEQVSKMASEFSKTTTFGAGAIKTGQNMLLTFTNIGKDVFPMATQSMLDLAQKMGGDPVNSSIQLGKALNDPTKGVTALTRVGVTFTEQQKKQIEAMQKAGDMAGAQKVILNELNKEFGGQAAAAAQTYEGRLKQLSNTIGAIKGSIGSALLPYVQKAAEFFLGLAQRVQSLPKPVTDVIAKVLGLVAVFGTLIGGIGLLQKIITMAIPQVGMFSTMFTKLKGPIGIIMIAIAGLTYAYQKNLGGFKTFVDGIIGKVGTMITAIVNTWQALNSSTGLTANNIKQLGSVFGKNTANIISILSGLKDGISIFKNVLSGNFSAAKNIIAQWSDGSCANIVKFLNYVRIFGTTLRAVFFGVLGLITGDFKNFGSTLQNGFGLSTGAVSKITTAFQTARNIIITVLQSIGTVVATVFGFLINHATAVITVLKLVAAGFAGLKAVQGVLSIVSILTSGFMKVINVLKILRNAYLGIQMLLMLNPVVGIIVGIVAVIAIIVLLWNKCSAFRNFFIGIWNAIKTGVISAVKGIEIGVVGAWNAIKAGVTTAINAIKNVITIVWSGIVSVVMAVIKPLVAGIMNIFNNMKAGLTNIFNGYKSIFTGIWNATLRPMIGIVVAIMYLVTGHFDKAKEMIVKSFQSIKTGLSQIWNGIKQVFIGTVQTIVGYVVGCFQNLSNNVITIWNVVKSFLTGLWNGIKDVAINTWNSICNSISSAMSAIGNIILSVWNGVLSFFASLPSKLLAFAIAMMNGLVNGITNGMNAVSSALHSGIENAISFIKNLPSRFFEWGADMLKGLANGIKSAIGEVSGAVTSVADKIKGMLHFSRPDYGPLADYETWMPDFMQGLGKGIKINTHLVTDPVNNLAVGVKTGITKTTSNKESTNNSGGSASKAIIINIPKLADKLVVRDDDDINKIANALAKHLENASLARG